MQSGDKVSWTKVSQRGRSLSMTLQEGTLETIMGDIACVRLKNGSQERVAVKLLRVEGQQSQIGEFVEALRKAHRN